MEEDKRVDADFKEALTVTDGDYVAAAVLALAKVVGRCGGEYLSHEICMGIRRGLFGSGADDRVSILDR